MVKWNRLSLLHRSVLESLKIVSYSIPSKIKLHIKKEAFDFSPVFKYSAMFCTYSMQ